MDELTTKLAEALRDLDASYERIKPPGLPPSDYQKRAREALRLYEQANAQPVQDERAAFEAWFADFRHVWKTEKDVAFDAFKAGAALALTPAPLNLNDPTVQKRLAAQWGFVPTTPAPAEPVAWGMRDKTTGLVLDVICPDEHDSFEGDYTVPLFAAPVAQAEPMNMALCEATKVVLREGQLYRFRRVGDCETCADLSKQSLEAYGQPPKENTHD